MYDKIVEHFGYNTPFTAKELYDFYRLYEDHLKESTFRWRVYDLRKKGKISSIAKGKYILQEGVAFNYDLKINIKRIYNMVNKMFPDETICIWTTKWLNRYMNHQPFNYFIILEVDRYIIDVVFQQLKNRFGKVYINPKNEEINTYILDENAIIIKPIIKEAPLTVRDKIRVPKVEKILVDIFFESNLLITYQGKEMINIFEGIFNMHSINITTLLRYAKNRGIKGKLENFLLNDIKIDNKYLQEVRK